MVDAMPIANSRQTEVVSLPLEIVQKIIFDSGDIETIINYTIATNDEYPLRRSIDAQRPTISWLKILYGILQLKNSNHAVCMIERFKNNLDWTWLSCYGRKSTVASAAASASIMVAYSMEKLWRTVRRKNCAKHIGRAYRRKHAIHGNVDVDYNLIVNDNDDDDDDRFCKNSSETEKKKLSIACALFGSMNCQFCLDDFVRTRIEHIKERVWRRMGLLYPPFSEGLSCDFIELYADRLNWAAMSSHQTLSPRLIDKYFDRVNWISVSKFQKLPYWLIYKYRDRVDWEEISCNQILSETFLTTYARRVNWTLISRYQYLSEDFIQRMRKLVDWRVICEYQDLSEQFLLSMRKYVYVSMAVTHQASISGLFVERNLRHFKRNADLWTRLFYKDRLRNDLINAEFLRRNRHLVNWDAIWRYQRRIPMNIIETFRDEITNWRMLCLRQRLSEQFMEANSERIVWDAVSMGPGQLSDEFILKHATKLHWYWLCRCQRLSQNVMWRCCEHLEWRIVSRYQKLDEAFMAINATKLDWIFACQYQRMSEKFMSLHAERIHWDNACKYQHMGEKFIERWHEYMVWRRVTKYQVLSATFIVKNLEWLLDDWDRIIEFQERLPTDEFVRIITKTRTNFSLEDLLYKRTLRRAMVKMFNNLCSADASVEVASSKL